MTSSRSHFWHSAYSYGVLTLGRYPPIHPSLHRIKICAHRGASGTHPENTLVAFRQAIEIGCEMIEFDLRLSADGQVVVIHDANIDRTTDGTGHTPDLTLEQLRALDAGSWYGAVFAGERIPTLIEVLDCTPPRVELNIHVKEGSGHRDILATLEGELRSRSRFQSAFISGSEELVADAGTHHPALRRCLLPGSRHGRLVERAIRAGCCAIQPSARLTTSDLVHRAQTAGLRVHPYFADDESETRRLAMCGVDAILTNHPARLLALRT